MNIFRLAGDLLHLLSIFLLIYKILKTRSCAGVSLKTQELYSIVFVTRYLDLMTTFISYYNTIMKIFFISSSVFIIYLMRYKFYATYDRDFDVWRKLYLIVPCGIVSLIFTETYEIMEILWTFSLFLEAVAILPQLLLLIKKGKTESLTRDYMGTLGAYRGFYVLNWIWRYFTEGYIHPQAFIAGVIQTALYSEFLYKYIKYDIAKRYELPGVSAGKRF